MISMESYLRLKSRATNHPSFDNFHWEFYRVLPPETPSQFATMKLIFECTASRFFYSIDHYSLITLNADMPSNTVIVRQQFDDNFNILKNETWTVTISDDYFNWYSPSKLVSNIEDTILVLIDEDPPFRSCFCIKDPFTGSWNIHIDSLEVESNILNSEFYQLYFKFDDKDILYSLELVKTNETTNLYRKIVESWRISLNEDAPIFSNLNTLLMDKPFNHVADYIRHSNRVVPNEHVLTFNLDCSLELFLIKKNQNQTLQFHYYPEHVKYNALQFQSNYSYPIIITSLFLRTCYRNPSSNYNDIILHSYPGILEILT